MSQRRTTNHSSVIAITPYLINPLNNITRRCLSRLLWTWNKDENWQEFWFFVIEVTEAETEMNTETDSDMDTVWTYFFGQSSALSWSQTQILHTAWDQSVNTKTTKSPSVSSGQTKPIWAAQTQWKKPGFIIFSMEFPGTVCSLGNCSPPFVGLQRLGQTSCKESECTHI